MSAQTSKSSPPEVDMACCTLCMGCLEVCPEVFSFNEAAEFIEVAELKSYPEDKLREAINICPRNCISRPGSDT
ncbi:ferredoxin [Dethiosulfatarculus sandiegensis]|uniref:Ferredoxin n=1 Tax=Dethiosulfatarculus sandiegensis TaxID=1429043 RepID=A0A0D2HM74_9BACT|nr:ferredoxin [Dethiosulfatarculus sandiegensis]KIX11718.1 ferredoxin [Dethiosulfatarculus sandiegensis]